MVHCENIGYLEKRVCLPSGKAWHLPHTKLNSRKPEIRFIVLDCAAEFQEASMNDDEISIREP